MDNQDSPLPQAGVTPSQEGSSPSPPVDSAPTPPPMKDSEVVAELRAEKQYNTALKEFQSSQERILKAAETKLPQICKGCSTVCRNNTDKTSLKKNGKCFGCYTKTEEHKTKVTKDTMAAEETSRIAALDLSDYEDWLFGDEMGQRSLARIITKLKREGYDYKPWQISIAASAWSKDNYHDTKLMETRHLAERVKIAEIINYIPESGEQIREVIASVKRAEEFMAPPEPAKPNYTQILTIAGLTAVAVSIPFILGRE